MDKLQENTDCLTVLSVTVTQSSAVNPHFDVFKEFLVTLPTERVNYLCEHSNIADFFYMNDNKECVVTTMAQAPKIRIILASKIVGQQGNSLANGPDVGIQTTAHY